MRVGIRVRDAQRLRTAPMLKVARAGRVTVYPVLGFRAGDGWATPRNGLRHFSIRDIAIDPAPVSGRTMCNDTCDLPSSGAVDARRGARRIAGT